MKSHLARRDAFLLAAVLLVLVGIVGSVYGARTLAQDHASSQRKDFDTTSKQVASALKLSIRREQDLVVSVNAQILENPDITNSEMRSWAGHMHALKRNPELMAMGFVQYVPQAQLDGVMARLKADPTFPPSGKDPFAVVPAGQRPFYCLLAAAAVRPGGLPPLPGGVDFCSDEEAVTGGKDLMESARGGVGSYEPASFGDGPPVLSILSPVYRGGTTPKSVTGRRAALLGWAATPVQPHVVLERALEGHPNTALKMRFKNNVSDVSFNSGKAAADGQSATLPIGQGWTAKVAGPAAGSGLFDSSEATLVLFGGLTLTALTGLLLFVLGTGRARALNLVTQKTGELKHLALHDALTGLPNRLLVMDRAAQMLSRAERQPNGIAALYVDVDGFKHVNDSFGHAAGDEVLKTVSQRLLEVVRDTDTVGRLGGDEFVVLLESASAEAPPQMVAERLIEVLHQPIEIDGVDKTVGVSVSIGIAAGRRSSPDELLRDADLALYAAKAAGKDRYVLFEAKMQTEADDRSKLKFDLIAAIEHEQFFLQYQPTFDLQNERVTGVEALIRWQHPERGVLAPDSFISIAEDTGLIVPIGRWVLREACRQAAIWHSAGHELEMSVNVSAIQCDNAGLELDIRSALEDSGLDPASLTLEITETALMRDVTAALNTLREIKELGVRIAIDDFGTGYSSLAYLRQFPIDSLKIDRSFISEAATDQSTAIVNTLVQLGKALNIDTVAEGIEEQSQLDRLQDQAVDHGQGFLFSKPLDVDDIEAFLDQKRDPTAPDVSLKPSAD